MSVSVFRKQNVYNTGIVDGKKYVSLSTFGSSTRQNGGLASLIIHVDKESAEHKIDILKRNLEYRKSLLS